MVIEEIDSGDTEHLALLARPELGVTFSKLHAWRLTHYTKCVFLDADALVLQNIDELFDRDELSAAPDVGWPDCFNTGVFVFEPSLDTFSSLMAMAGQFGSFDGEFPAEANILTEKHYKKVHTAPMYCDYDVTGMENNAVLYICGVYYRWGPRSAEPVLA